MLSDFFKRKASADSIASRVSFNHIMEFAGELATTNPLALPDLVRALGRPLQWYHLTTLIGRELHGAIDEVEVSDLFFDPSIPVTPNGDTLESLRTEVLPNSEFLLTLDLLLPTPWERSRLLGCLESIGGVSNPWKQDDFNHRVEAWEPLHLGFVHGGNHSIATGIIKGEGTIRAEVTYDISRIYEYVSCDGVHYRRREDQTVVSDVKNVEFAAIFEIGRLLVRPKSA